MFQHGSSNNDLDTQKLSKEIKLINGFKSNHLMMNSSCVDAVRSLNMLLPQTGSLIFAVVRSSALRRRPTLFWPWPKGFELELHATIWPWNILARKTFLDFAHCCHIARWLHSKSMWCCKSKSEWHDDTQKWQRHF